MLVGSSKSTSNGVKSTLNTGRLVFAGFGWGFWGGVGVPFSLFFKIGSLLTFRTGLSCLSALDGQVWHFLQFHL